MAVEQQRVTVRLIGATAGTTGEGWCYYLRDGNGSASHAMYPTAKAARQAGERALKRLARA